MAVDAAVVGAGGPTGRLCVENLLAAGKSVRALVRSPDKYKDTFPASESLELVKGDVTDPSTLKAALGDARGIIFAAAGASYFAANAVENEGVANVATVAKETGAHVVLISTALVTPKNRWHPIRIILNNAIRYNLTNEKFLGENQLRSSGAAYTVIRPGGLVNTPPGKAKLLVAQGDDAGLGTITRGDTAAVCVAALCNPKAMGRTFELRSNSKLKPEPNDMATLFDGLKPGMAD